MDQAMAFLDFEYVFGIAALIVLGLMYVFYVRYPYGKDVEPEEGE